VNNLDITQSGGCTGSDLRLLFEAVWFYADKENWRSPSKGFAAQYDPEPSPVEKDGGRRAREAMEKIGG